MTLFLKLVRPLVAMRLRAWRNRILAKAERTATRTNTAQERRIQTLERQLDRRTRDLQLAEPQIEVYKSQLDMLAKWQNREEQRLDREAARYAVDRAVAHRQSGQME